MAQSGAGLARDIALSLVDELTAYDQELMALQLETPTVGPLREALAQAIADACCVIAEDPPHSGRTATAH